MHASHVHAPKRPSYGRLVGLAAPWNVLSPIRGDNGKPYQLVIRNGAFKEAVRETRAKRLTVRLLHEHGGEVLASTHDALSLHEGVAGLTIHLDEAWRAGRAVRDLIRDREYGLSIEIDNANSVYRSRVDASEVQTRDYSAVSLLDIALTDHPCFTDTWVRRIDWKG